MNDKELRCLNTKGKYSKITNTEIKWSIISKSVMIIIFVEFIDQLIDCPINRASLSLKYLLIEQNSVTNISLSLFSNNNWLTRQYVSEGALYWLCTCYFMRWIPVGRDENIYIILLSPTLMLYGITELHSILGVVRWLIYIKENYRFLLLTNISHMTCIFALSTIGILRHNARDYSMLSSSV